MGFVIYLGDGVKVRDVMTEDVVTISPDDCIKVALDKLLEAGISGAPVVEEEEVVGVITESDLFEEFRKVFPASEINRVLSRTFNTLKAIRKLSDSHKGDRGKLKNFLERDVSRVMTKDVYTVSPKKPLKSVSRIMDKEGINHVPVVKEDRLVGIVTKHDLILGLSQR